MRIDTCERDIWPITAWAGGIVTAATIAMAVAAIWLESGKLGITAVISLFVATFLWIATDAFASGEITYSVKPRGWRKLRRDAEREAYRAKLERETGLR